MRIIFDFMTMKMLVTSKNKMLKKGYIWITLNKKND